MNHSDIHFGGRCEIHLKVKPCLDCINQVTPPNWKGLFTLLPHQDAKMLSPAPQRSLHATIHDDEALEMIRRLSDQLRHSTPDSPLLIDASELLQRRGCVDC